jgi:anti-sigma regulatory factor (Ser/Thr protein kinase)
MRWAFAPVLTTPTRARRQLADQLCRWGITGPESESVLLVAHELVANAVDHARTALELAVSFDGRAVVVAVQDGSMLEPRLRPLDLAAARGRGLQMVDALAKSWHWVQHAGGKTVQAVIITRLVVCRMVLVACVG